MELENEEGLEQEEVEQSLLSNDREQMVHSIRKKGIMVEQMDRSQLVGSVRNVLRARNCLVERERQEGVDTMLEIAGQHHIEVDGEVLE